MDENRDDFLDKFTRRLWDGSLPYEDYVRFIRAAIEEGDPTCRIIYREIINNLDLKEKEKEFILQDTDVDAVAEFLYGYVQSVASLRNTITGGLDNIEYIVSNICSIFYIVFPKYRNRYSVISLFKLTLRIDLDYYIVNNEYLVDDLYVQVEKLLRKHILSFEEDFDLTPYIEPGDHSVVNTLLQLCLLALFIIAKVDTTNVSDEQVFNYIVGEIDKVKDKIDDMFDDPSSSFMGNEVLRRNLSDKLDNQNILEELDAASLHRDAFIYIITDINKHTFIDYSVNIGGTGFTVDKALKFFDAYDPFINHEKEHLDYITFLKENKNTLRENLLKDIPDLNRDKVIQLASSVNYGDNKLAAICYLFGIEVEQDFEKTYNILVKGVELMDAEAVYQLSTLYLKGIHVRYDYKKWIEYLSLACKLGDKNAVDQWREIKKTSELYNSKINQTSNHNNCSQKTSNIHTRSSAPAITFWLLFSFFFILAIIITSTVAVSGASIFVIAAVFLVLAIVKTIQYNNSK